MEEVIIPKGMEVAKGITEFGLLAMVTGFYLVITAVMMVLFIRWFVKIVNGIFDSQQKTLDSILALLQNQGSKLSQVKEALTGELFNQVRVVSTYAFDFNLHQVMPAIAQIKEDNNLENREGVESKLRLILKNIFERRDSNFDAFTFNGKKLSSYTSDSWTDRIYQFCIEAIYDGYPYHRTRYLKNPEHFHEEVKLEFLENLKKM